MIFSLVTAPYQRGQPENAFLLRALWLCLRGSWFNPVAVNRTRDRKFFRSEISTKSIDPKMLNPFQ